MLPLPGLSCKRNYVIFETITLYSSQNLDGASKFSLPSSQEGLVSVSGYLDFESMYRANNFNESLTYYDLIVTARVSKVNKSNVTLCLNRVFQKKRNLVSKRTMYLFLFVGYLTDLI